jgi:hypothetical protein
MTNMMTTTGTAKNSTDKNDKKSVAEGISHLAGLSDDDASTASSVKRSPRKKSRALSMMRKNPTAKEHLDVMLTNRQAWHELIRSKKKSERLAARRIIPTEALEHKESNKALEHKKESNNITSDCDTLANGLNDRPTVWKQWSEDDASSIEFDGMSRSGGDDDDDDDSLINL